MAENNFAMSDLSWIKQSDNKRLFTKKFQLIVTLSRLFGCHPHPIFSGDSPRTSRLAKSWSIVWVVLSTITCGFAMRDLITSEQIFRSGAFHKIVVLISFVISTTMSVVRAEKFDKAVKRIQEFDNAASYANERGIVENFVAAGLTVVTWAVLAWISNVDGIDKDNIDLTTVMYLLGIGMISLEVYKFCFVFVALHRRFVHLKDITSSGKIDIRSTKGHYYQPLTVQTVFILNHKLADAVFNFNRYYDIQIVYWLAYFITDLIIELYLVIAKPLIGMANLKSIVRRAFALYHPALVCTVSHFTCKKANELGKLLFGYEAPILATTVSSLENLEFGFWLFQQPLKITGLELFTVDLPLFLSMIEASATYATFILQRGH